MPEANLYPVPDEVVDKVAAQFSVSVPAWNQPWASISMTDFCRASLRQVKHDRHLQGNTGVMWGLCNTLQITWGCSKVCGQISGVKAGSCLICR